MVFYCRNMQTVQYLVVLPKSKVCFRWSNASYMCPKSLYVGPQKLFLGGFKLCSQALIFGTSYEVLILACLGVFLEANLNLFWRA